MMIKQSSAKRLPFRLVDETDGTTAETGLAATAAVTISKNGGAFAPAGGTITEVGNGRYYYTPTTTETNTLGYLEYRVTCTGCREFPGLAQVVAYDPEDAAALGLSRLDVALSTLATAAALTSAAGDVTTLLGRLSSARAGYLDNLSAGAVALASALATAQADVTTLIGRLTSGRAAGLDNLDAAISTRASGAALASVATDAGTAAAAAASAASSASAAATSAASVDTKLTTTRAGYLDAAITSRAPATLTDATIATAVGSALTTDHGSGSWQTGSGGASADAIADAVRDKAIAGAASGSIGAALSSLLTGQTSLASAVAALPSASAIAAAVLAATLEGAHTVAGGLRMLLAVAAGRRTVSGTTHTFRDLGNTKSRVVATVDSSGNRSVASTADGT